jgi:hypothetical protein
MMPPMRLAALTVVCVVTSLAGTAAAQDTNKVAAEAAFQKGKELEDAGQTAEACEQFARSQQLDPQLGTLYNLARCHQRLGKLASAWQEFTELAAKDTNKKRKADATKQAKALAPRLTRMRLVVTAPAAGLVIERDGVDVTALVDLETPVDPATYAFRATAPGRLAWQAEVEFTAEGQTITIDVPELAAEPVKTDGDGDGAGGADGDGDGGGDGDGDGGGAGAGVGRPLPVGPRDGGGGSGKRWLGLGVGAAGVVATGVGVVFGLKARGLVADAEDACGGPVNPCAGDVIQAEFDIADARSAATLSTGLVAGGLVLTAVGAYLYLTAPSGGGGGEHAAIAPAVGADHAGVQVHGRF